MADLVGDDVGLRELARRAEPLLEDLVEAQVDVDLLVVGAIEGTHRRLALAARRRPAALEEDELGRLVGAARLAEDVGPDLLGAAQHLGDEFRPGVVRRRGRRGALLLHHLPPPSLPPIMPSSVSGLMPKIQPAITATAMLPMPMPRPPMPKPPPPPPMPRTSSTLLLSSWPSMRMSYSRRQVAGC
jgi:hypothetical protein